MPRPRVVTKDLLAPLLMARGPVSAAELAALLRVDRTTIVRGLAEFGEELVILGAKRSTRYLRRRSIQNIGNRWSIYRIDEVGRAWPWAVLEALHERRWRIEWAGPAPEWAECFSERGGLWDGFPFFLGGVRPQGFLGRVVARQLSLTLGVPDDPGRWSDEDTVVYLQAAGEDVPGSLVVGDECVRRALARAISPREELVTLASGRKARYPRLAEAAAGLFPGSSAGGEQPKFLTTLQDKAGGFQPVLVKFSPPLDQATGSRWADLLRCEHHALTVLADHGLASKGSGILEAGGRCFLEVPRFDRVGLGGRRGVISLAAILPEALGFHPGVAWMEAIPLLQAGGLIDAEATATICRLHAFGELIGNTDMHAGNLAFWLEETRSLRVAPAYDMLPMLWAPGVQGEIRPRIFAPEPPLPARAGYWREAAGWAQEFWGTVADDAGCSPTFQEIARTAFARLQRLRAHGG